MKFIIILFCFYPCSSLAVDCSKYGKIKNDSGWCVPTIKQKESLGNIFTFLNCSYLSGLTCKVKYNGKQLLSQKIYYSQYNLKGEFINKKLLIYPKLNPDEFGIVTFFHVHGATTNLVIE
ncbi:MAG: hypothetical protein D6B27_03205 [Gammaproteobacteria bacterium]|nr:MAG: hypothetical protein D6B27_03205 [Gammaproteobacteria bacterium]